MNIFSSKAILACILGALIGCGSTQTSIPDPVRTISAAPGDLQRSTTDLNQGAFSIFFAESQKDIDDPTADVTVRAGRASLFATTDGQVTIVTDKGTEYVFEEDLVTPKSGGQATEYRYKQVGGSGTNFLLVNRFADGSRNGFFLVGPADQPSDLRASFYYGWSTDPTKIPASGVATYSNDGGGQIFLSDGKRLFNGRTSLDVDFAARSVDGVLVDTTGRAQNDLEAKLTLTGGTFNTAGDITSNGGLTLELINTQNPFTSITPITGSVSGKFLGPDADALAGNFMGTANVNQTNFGTSTVTFVGVFGGSKIPTVVVPPTPIVPLVAPPLIAQGILVASPENATSEVGLGSFDVVFAQSDRDPSLGRVFGRGTITTGRLKLFSQTAGEVVIETGSGTQYEFVETSANPISADTIEYTYAAKDGGAETLFLTRDSKGNQRGYFSVGPVGGVADLRAWIHYGFPTDPGQLTTGAATYQSASEGRLFLSDGWRLFNGTTNLNVDFGAGSVNGVLFDNTAQPGQPVTATVSLAGGTINNGRVSVTDGINLTLTDSITPFTKVDPVTTSSLDGQFIGNAPGNPAQNLIGTYDGLVNVDHPDLGAGTMVFGGSFAADKQ